MTSSPVRIRYAFGENIDAIVWRVNVPGHMDKTCKRILTRELSREEVEYLKKSGDLMGKVTYEYVIRDKRPPFFSEGERMQKRFYLAPDLESFEVCLDKGSLLIQEAYKARAIAEGLMESASRSNEALRRVARLYNAYWETKRRTELAGIARKLQSALVGHPDPIEKVEKTLRGCTGVKDINYYIVDNLYPTCRTRHFSCHRWFVGWADPPEFASPKHVLQIVCNEALHLIPQDIFTEKRRHDLARLLNARLDKRQKKILTRYADPQQKLLECVDGAAQMLMEGFGHTFIGFPWMEDEIPKELRQPRRMGKEGTPYYESYHFTKWFHDHWKRFLENPSISAKDWALQCINENKIKFLRIAQKFLGTTS